MIFKNDKFGFRLRMKNYSIKKKIISGFGIIIIVNIIFYLDILNLELNLMIRLILC